MTHDDTPPSKPEAFDPELAALGAAQDKAISPAARRALEEAAARRAAHPVEVEPHENGGPRGLEPTRFGDWERKGLAVDF